MLPPPTIDRPFLESGGEAGDDGEGDYDGGGYDEEDEVEDVDEGGVGGEPAPEAERVVASAKARSRVGPDGAPLPRRGCRGSGKNRGKGKEDGKGSGIGKCSGKPKGGGKSGQGGPGHSGGGRSAPY
jgi:hypothetical protein